MRWCSSLPQKMTCTSLNDYFEVFEKATIIQNIPSKKGRKLVVAELIQAAQNARNIVQQQQHQQHQHHPCHFLSHSHCLALTRFIYLSACCVALFVLFYSFICHIPLSSEQIARSIVM